MKFHRLANMLLRALRSVTGASVDRGWLRRKPSLMGFALVAAMAAGISKLWFVLDKFTDQMGPLPVELRSVGQRTKIKLRPFKVDAD
jgi:hypothetical protein